MKKYIKLLLELGLLALIIKMLNDEKEKVEYIKQENIKMSVNNEILKDWLLLRQAGAMLANWFMKEKIASIAIYGYGILGKALYNELKNSAINVICIIDKNSQNLYADIDVVNINEIPKVDMVVVTAINYYDEIEEELLTVTSNSIISLEDIIYGMGIDYE